MQILLYLFVDYCIPFLENDPAFLLFFNNLFMARQRVSVNRLTGPGGLGLGSGFCSYF